MPAETLRSHTGIDLAGESWSGSSKIGNVQARAVDAWAAADSAVTSGSEWIP